jgi:hypothetical protein
VPSTGRENIHDISPRANMFFERCFSLLLTGRSLERADRQRGDRHLEDLVALERAVLERVLVVAGLASGCRWTKASVLTMSIPPGRGRRLVFSAAGFIATSTSGASPGVRMSWSAKCSWKPDTPGSEPAGARISAGKSGSVARSLPNWAVALVNRSAGELHAVAGVAGEADRDGFSGACCRPASRP